jgi:two-component system cell cycle response regulator DivK
MGARVGIHNAAFRHREELGREKVGNEKKILVIEDSSTHRKLIQEVLGSEGFIVHEAETAEKGLRIAAQEHPHLIFIDLYLPGLDGLEAANMIRSLEGMEEVPIVVMSASTSEKERERVLKADCDYYLRKPIDMEDLPHLASQLMEKGRECVDKGSIEKARTEERANPYLEREERLKAIEKVRAALNHDLRTPLTVMISYAHTVARGKVGEISEKQREMLETVVEQGFQMDTMINELVKIVQDIKEAEEPL